MRALSLAFIILISFMFAYPCSDVATCADEVKTGAPTSTTNHEHSSDESDVCSPFCQCSCCHTQVSQPAFYDLSTPVKRAPLQTGVDQCIEVKSIEQSIWQPPKLS